MMKRNHLSHRSIISLKGADRCTFLQGLITNDVQKLPVGGVCWAAMLNAQGRIQSVFFLWKTDISLFIDIVTEQSDLLIKTLRRFKLRADVDIALTTMSVMTGATDTPPPSAAIVSGQDPRHPAFGWRALLPEDAPHNNDDDEARLTRRLKAGLPDEEDIILGQTLVLEADMDALHGVSWQKGCYLGQEVTARTHYRGLIKKRLLPIISCNNTALPIEGTITHEGRDVGTLRSHEGVRGIALLHRQAWGASQLDLAGHPITINWPEWLPKDKGATDTPTSTP